MSIFLLSIAVLLLSIIIFIMIVKLKMIDDDIDDIKIVILALAGVLKDNNLIKPKEKTYEKNSKTNGKDKHKNQGRSK